MDHHNHSDAVPLWSDNSVGVLTKSVYDASATTQHTLEKLFGKLAVLQRKTSGFSVDLMNQEKDFISALTRSKSALNQALLQSKRIVNGMSDKEAAIVLNKMMVQLLNASKSVITAIEKKNLLRASLESQSREISGIARGIKAKTQKSFGVLSVAEKICANSKRLQGLSKSAVHRAETFHLAKASEAFHAGVSKIQEMLQIENQFIPYKTVSSQEMLPKGNIDKNLENAYTFSGRALNHVENALHMTGGARAREVVDVRDQIRAGMESEKDALKFSKNFADPKIKGTVVPENNRINELVTRELIPTMRAYKDINQKILGFVDPTGALDIERRLGLQVAKSGISYDIAFVSAAGACVGRFSKELAASFL